MDSAHDHGCKKTTFSNNLVSDEVSGLLKLSGPWETFVEFWMVVDSGRLGGCVWKNPIVEKRRKAYNSNIILFYLLKGCGSSFRKRDWTRPDLLPVLSSKLV